MYRVKAEEGGHRKVAGEQAGETTLLLLRGLLNSPQSCCPAVSSSTLKNQLLRNGLVPSAKEKRRNRHGYNQTRHCCNYSIQRRRLALQRQNGGWG